MWRLLAILTTVVIVLAGTGTGRADFVLTGSSHKEVNTHNDVGTLFDSSTANVVPGGHITDAYVNHASSLAVSGGNVANLWAYDTSSVDFSDGRIYNLRSYDTSNVNVSGGGSYNDILYALGTSTVDMSGGRFAVLWSNESSNVNVSGGLFDKLNFCASSNGNVSGGTVGSYLRSTDWSSVDISGGDIPSVVALDESSITFHGYDFHATDGLVLAGDMVLGTGVLTGKWCDGTPWTMDVESNRGQVRIVPEPSTWAMLLGVVLGWAWWRRR